jgi:TIGR03009 family protein
MRYPYLAVAGVLLASTLLHAQQPAETPEPQPSTLDFHLTQWESKMKGIETISAQITREKEDKVFRTRDVFIGEAKYMKPNLAKLELYKKGRPDVYEKFVITGAYLYEYYAQDKQIRIHELPKPKPGQVADNNFLSFMFGMKADEAKRRYDMKVVKESNYYVYLEIYPRTVDDKAEFQKAQLALLKNTYLPRMLIYTEAQGNKIQYDIQADTKARVDRNEFIQPELPKGWQWKPMKSQRTTSAEAPGGTEVPPRLVRPNAKP